MRCVEVLGHGKFRPTGATQDRWLGTSIARPLCGFVICNRFMTLKTRIVGLTTRKFNRNNVFGCLIMVTPGFGVDTDSAEWNCKPTITLFFIQRVCVSIAHIRTNTDHTCKSLGFRENDRYAAAAVREFIKLDLTTVHINCCGNKPQTKPTPVRKWSNWL